MNIATISSARANLFSIVKSVIDSHSPCMLTAKQGNVVLISEEDFRAIQETLDLQLITNLVKDVKSGRKEPKNHLKTRKDLPW